MNDQKKDNIIEIEKHSDKNNEKENDKKIGNHKVTKINKASLGATSTEAWADAESVDKNTKMNFPSEEAVDDAKEWVEENEK